ncbi:hypothetical protein BDV37DRAFT_285074 [Aspergillus pseudonomiae]|uniref:Rhodopsin domain-containing protein n=1 Tax=Aspergillus pseudonomiae TaxID=1506151 RepID=A0A5N7D817_9EURO|nr:uncharacterized protein BDV37DRAFT_285074 [Aspergillus pseudonomiae]KAE8402103.1 hypothetical protein BDV37DRAFT_285074 [Aspergillus pseudonomiae]
MGEYAPYVISATDRSGLLVIVATLFMSWMVIVCLIRLYMRLGMNGPIRIDDLVVFSGGVSRSLLLQQLWAKFYDVSTWQAFGIAHVGTIMHGVSHGLGRSQNETSASDLKSAAQTLYAANILFLVGHGAAKASVGFLLHRLGREKGYLLACKATLAVTVLWMIASILAIAISCTAQYQWSSEEHCLGLGIAWKAVSTFDVIIEICLIVLSVVLVWGIQMRRKEKATVIFAFATRISIIVLIIIRQRYLNTSLFRPDAPLHVSNSLVMTIVLLHCSIMVATIPCLKPFIIAFNTGWGQGVANSKGTTYYKQSATSASGNASRSRGPHSSGAEEEELDLTVVRHSHESQHSRQLIIHQTREWIVEETYEMKPMR